MTLELTQNRGLRLQKYLPDEQTSVIIQRRNLTASTSPHLQPAKKRSLRFFFYYYYLLKTVMVTSPSSAPVSENKIIRRCTSCNCALIFALIMKWSISWACTSHTHHPLFLITDDRGCFTFGNKMKKKRKEKKLLCSRSLGDFQAFRLPRCLKLSFIHVTVMWQI